MKNEGHLESSKHGLVSQLPIDKPYHVWYHSKELSFFYVMHARKMLL